MPAQYYYMTSLPTLVSLGEQPGLSLAELLDRAGDIEDVRMVCSAVLLEHDLLARQAMISGEITEVQPAVLTAAQISGEQSLEDIFELDSGDESSRGAGEDKIWAAYFRYVNSVAAKTGCKFLSDWVGYEVALRNALVEARSRTLSLNAEEYFVAAELADSTSDVDAAITAWSAAEDPLTAMKALDAARWQWIESNGQWYSFELDEVAAYARALVLLDRWYEVSREQ